MNINYKIHIKFNFKSNAQREFIDLFLCFDIIVVTQMVSDIINWSLKYLMFGDGFF